MSDKIKINEIKALLQLDSWTTDQAHELINLVSSIKKDEEDKDLILQDVAVAFAKVGRYEKASELLDQIKAGYEKSDGNMKIASILVQAGKHDDVIIWLKVAEKAAEEVFSEWQAAELLNNIAECFRSIDKKEEVIRVLNKAASIAQRGELTENAQDSLDCSSVICDISATLAKVGEIQRAYRLALSIRNQGKRERAIKQLEGMPPPSRSR